MSQIVEKMIVNPAAVVSNGEPLMDLCVFKFADGHVEFGYEGCNVKHGEEVKVTGAVHGRRSNRK